MTEAANMVNEQPVPALNILDIPEEIAHDSDEDMELEFSGDDMDSNHSEEYEDDTEFLSNGSNSPKVRITNNARQYNPSYQHFSFNFMNLCESLFLFMSFFRLKHMLIPV